MKCNRVADTPVQKKYANLGRPLASERRRGIIRDLPGLDQIAFLPPIPIRPEQNYGIRPLSPPVPSGKRCSGRFSKFARGDPRRREKETAQRTAQPGHYRLWGRQPGRLQLEQCN